ncbi:SusC/RagA family TonB-linked outer membrane protein [Myroides sp. N17-2]|uniref:SusC/RagA family TonB-linked outer membrane protein n=1 Tax=Myroides sp. N17-2 TaxID=2030799 RepID=UPI002110E271|nr:SusC/RagA family TonB-linked outer membrane protein [Myroides sp. N17-2]
MNTSTSYSQQSNNLPTFDLTNMSLILAPNAPALYNTDGTLNWENGTFSNPLAALEETYENKTQTLILNTNLSYLLTDNLFFKLNAGLTTNLFEERKITPHTINNPAFGLTSERSSSSKSDQNTNAYIVEPQLQYKKTLNNHRFDALIGSTYQTTENNSGSMRGVGFSSNALIRNIGAANQKYIGETRTSQYKYLAFFTRLNYSFDNKYFLNITARRDGSSRFAENNRFGNFGAIGGAWIFSDESFIQNLSWLSFGKLRSSYGVTGSDNIGDYAYLDTYSVSPALYNSETGLYPVQLHNANYKWEKTTKFEAALELGFFKDRVNTSIAYYNNRSTDQLVGMTLPSTTGFSTLLINSPAVVENTGWEFTLNTNNITSANWTWKTNFNITFPKNKLVAYPGLEEGTQSSFYVIGQPLNIIKTYEYKGLNPDTGMFEFTDFNSDGKFNALDKKLVKNLNPSFYGGIQNSISYKNFTLDFLFYFKKQDNYNINKLYVTPGAPIYNQPVQMTDRWSPTNPNAPYMRGVYNNAKVDNLATLFRDSDNSISDASYIRLKNASISYTLKIPKVNIESLRIYLQGQNLWTITSFKGMDPEFSSFGYLPPLRTYSFGMQLIF